MCTLDNNTKLRKPTKKTFTAYKVFNGCPCFSNHGDGPTDFFGHRAFKVGKNVWNKAIAEQDNNYQIGFQMFSTKKNAMSYATISDFVAPVSVETKDIVKIGNVIGGLTDYGRGYEVTKFVLKSKDWEQKTQK